MALAEQIKIGGDEMTILEIFEKVNLQVPLEQRRFFNYFNDSVIELSSLYPDFLFQDNAEFTPINTLSDENIVLPLYTGAIIDNILFLSGQDETYKGEFIRKSKSAYLKYWNDNAKGRKMKRMGW
ncbi:MAG: hypothetical protein GX800_00500 [Clostridiaceae bacterium]|nr:hypothetical protein [Clostridiaceae bacterium]